MAHDEDGARPLGEDAFQPEDAVHVEVVGRLVHQQDVGRGRQLARDRQPLPPAAGQRLDLGAAVREAGPAEGLRDAPGALVLVHRGQRGGDHVLDGAAGREDRILRHVADADAAAHGAGAAVGALDPGENLEERGLAGAVRTHEAHLVAVEEAEGQLGRRACGPRRPCRPPRSSGAVTGPSARGRPFRGIHGPHCTGRLGAVGPAGSTGALLAAGGGDEPQPGGRGPHRLSFPSRRSAARRRRPRQAPPAPPAARGRARATRGRRSGRIRRPSRGAPAGRASPSSLPARPQW